MELIYENKYGKAEYDRATKTVRTQYIGVSITEPIIDYLSKVILYSEKQRIKHGITNLTQMKGTFTGAMDFIENEFYPKMINNGLITYAMVISNDIFTKFAADQLTKKIGGKLDWRVFSSLEEAEKWTSSMFEAHKQEELLKMQLMLQIMILS
jgi:hypothetical protein